RNVMHVSRMQAWFSGDFREKLVAPLSVPRKAAPRHSVKAFRPPPLKGVGASAWIETASRVEVSLRRFPGDRGQMHVARRIGINALLVIISVALFFAGLEVFVRVTDMRVSATPSAPPPAVVPDRFAGIPQETLARAEARRSFLTMPEDWKLRMVDVPGS